MDTTEKGVRRNSYAPNDSINDVLLSAICRVLWVTLFVLHDLTLPEYYETSLFWEETVSGGSLRKWRKEPSFAFG